MIEERAFAIEDVVYLERPTGALQARLYRPNRPERVPGVVSVHGGRWCADSRLTNAVIDEALANAGIFVMAVDFRAPPDSRYPGPVADINAAIRWLKTRRDAFAIQPGRLGGVGTSSGGHQLLLNALCPDAIAFSGDPPRPPGEPDASLAYAVVCWPVTDPLGRYRYALDRKMTLHVDCHHAYWPDEAAMAAGNPLAIVKDGRARRLPPLLIIQGTADDVLQPGSSEAFAAAYRDRGGAVTLGVYPDVGHTFITKDPASAASRAALDQMIRFIHATDEGGFP